MEHIPLFYLISSTFHITSFLVGAPYLELLFLVDKLKDRRFRALPHYLHLPNLPLSLPLMC